MGNEKIDDTDTRASTGGAGAKTLLGSAKTVPRFPTGGAGAKPLLGSSNTVQCQVRLGLVRFG